MNGVGDELVEKAIGVLGVSVYLVQRLTYPKPDIMRLKTEKFVGLSEIGGVIRREIESSQPIRVLLFNEEI
jgi:hypothetical protein